VSQIFENFFVVAKTLSKCQKSQYFSKKKNPKSGKKATTTTTKQNKTKKQ